MAFCGMGFKMRIKSFNSEAQGSKWHYKACDPKWHSAAWGSKCELNLSIVKHRHFDSELPWLSNVPGIVIFGSGVGNVCI
jgi:hypothetical protein